MIVIQADGSKIRVEELYDSAVEQWLEQTPEDQQTFESFCSFLHLAGFIGWGGEWYSDRWEELWP